MLSNAKIVKYRQTNKLSYHKATLTAINNPFNRDSHVFFDIMRENA